MNKGILELLIVAIKEQGDLPALSVNIKNMLTELNRPEIVETSLEELVPLVSSDMGLTKGVFSLVNSPMYSAYGRGVTTLSRALLILGTDALTNLAIRQRVAETVLDPNKLSSREALKALNTCVQASALGRQIAQMANHPRPDQIALQCLLTGLGRLLVTAYLPDQFETLGITPQMSLKEGDDLCFKKYQLTFGEIGRALCSSWGIPVKATQEEFQIISLVADAAHFCVERNDQGLVQVLTDLEQQTGVTGKDLSSSVKLAVAQAEDMLMESGVDISRATREKADPALLLAELESSTASTPLSAIINQSVEVLKEILGADNACVFALSSKTQRYSARLCLGERALKHKALLEFDSAMKSDLFSLAVRQERPFYVRDIRVSGIREKLPVWFLSSLYEDTSSVLMIPLLHQGRCIASYYLDWETSQFDGLSSEQQSQILRVLKVFDSCIRTKI